MEFRKLINKVWTRVGWVGSFLLLVGFGVFISKFCEDSVHTHERGALVASIVDQQFHELGSGSSPDYRRSQVALKRWVIGQVLLPSCDPEELARQIDTFKGSLGSHSPMRVTLERWSSTLQDWQREPKEVPSSRSYSEDLMREGRQHYFEAAGFRKIGRAYDATILNLWTISLLTRFIHQSPYSASVPEALFMLGAAYAGLGHALPAKMRGDRILNLCSELYPDSLWADRAQTIWREAYGDEI